MKDSISKPFRRNHTFHPGLSHPTTSNIRLLKHTPHRTISLSLSLRSNHNLKDNGHQENHLPGEVPPRKGRPDRLQPGRWREVQHLTRCASVWIPFFLECYQKEQGDSLTYLQRRHHKAPRLHIRHDRGPHRVLLCFRRHPLQRYIPSPCRRVSSRCHSHTLQPGTPVVYPPPPCLPNHIPSLPHESLLQLLISSHPNSAQYISSSSHLNSTLHPRQ